MRLNKECIRDTLLYIEEHCVSELDKHGEKVPHEVTFIEINNSTELANYSEEDKYYTVQKLFEGRYINGRVVPVNQYENFDLAFITSLTLKGHDLLDNIRPEKVWKKTKNTLKKVGDFSLNVMSQVAGEIMAAYTKGLLNP